MDKTTEELAHDAAVMLLASIVAASLLAALAVGIFFGIGWAVLALLSLVLANMAVSVLFYRRKIREMKGAE